MDGSSPATQLKDPFVWSICCCFHIPWKLQTLSCADIQYSLRHLPDSKACSLKFHRNWSSVVKCPISSVHRRFGKLDAWTPWNLNPLVNISCPSRNPDESKLTFGICSLEGCQVFAVGALSAKENFAFLLSAAQPFCLRFEKIWRFATWFLDMRIKQSDHIQYTFKDKQDNRKAKKQAMWHLMKQWEYV